MKDYDPGKISKAQVLLCCPKRVTRTIYPSFVVTVTPTMMVKMKCLKRGMVDPLPSRSDGIMDKMLMYGGGRLVEVMIYSMADDECGEEEWVLSIPLD